MRILPFFNLFIEAKIFFFFDFSRMLFIYFTFFIKIKFQSFNAQYDWKIEKRVQNEEGICVKLICFCLFLNTTKERRNIIKINIVVHQSNPSVFDLVITQGLN